MHNLEGDKCMWCERYHYGKRMVHNLIQGMIVIVTHNYYSIFFVVYWVPEFGGRIILYDNTL